MATPAPSHLRVIQVLLDEHAAIKEALLLLHCLTRRLTGRSAVPLSDLRTVTTFLREYADTIHHFTEEDVLFPSVQRSRNLRSMSQKLMTQHTMGRIFLEDMTEAVKAASIGRRGWRKHFVDSATAYHTLLTIHICDEDNIFFPEAERFLRRSRQPRLRNLTDQQAKDGLLARMSRLRRRYLPAGAVCPSCPTEGCASAAASHK